MRAELDFPDAHLRQNSHEDVVETFLAKLRRREYSGQKPSKGHNSDMFPPMSDGHSLAQFLSEQTMVITHLACNDDQDLGGCALVCECMCIRYLYV
tara:strand:- start:34 stop:321 length:288 start_codon:yes stop_codon:yes gene_type:complete